MDVALLLFLIFLNAAVRHVGDGAHRQPQGEAAGHGRSRAIRAPAMRWPCTTTRPSSSRWCRSASPRSASSTASSATPPSRRRSRTGCTRRSAMGDRRGARSPPPAWWSSPSPSSRIVFGELVPKRLGLHVPGDDRPPGVAADGMALGGHPAVRPAALLVAPRRCCSCSACAAHPTAASPRRRSPPASRRGSMPA